MKKLIIIVVAVIFYITCTTPLCAQQNKVAAKPGLKFEGKVALSSLITIVDSHIENIAGKLALASITEEAQSGDWQRIKPLLAQIQKEEGNEATVWFALPDGSYYTVDLELTDKNLKDRSYFPEIMAGEVSVGHLVISKSTGDVSTIIAVPVKNGGKVTGALGLSLFTKKLSIQVKNKMGLADNIVFYALNKDHITVINAKSDRVYLDPEKQDSASMTKAIKMMLSRDEGVLEYDFHGLRRVVFRKSAYTGWWYAIGLPVKK